MRFRWNFIPFIVIFILVFILFGNVANAKLKFGEDGTFKVLVVSDLHFKSRGDAVGVALIEKLLDTEKPGMVVLNGDTFSLKQLVSEKDLRKVISLAAAPMEDRKIPWAITFGNHDAETSIVSLKMSKPEILKIIETYPHNVNKGWVRGLSGGGNKNLLIWDSIGKQPVFNVWLIDSGSDPPNKKTDRYDYVRKDQIDWYVNTSKELESKYGGKIPSVMFFHIPLPEWIEMRSAGSIQGDQNEVECPSNVNSGLFAIVLARGDVKGMFCGHDHVNNYVGLWKGIKLGYDSAIGSTTYDLEPADNPGRVRTRGGRVILIKESDPWNFKTWMRYRDMSKSEPF